jgi:tetratricopeptide (TPR) repeat protein
MLAGELGHRRSEAIVLDSLALLCGLDGDFERARSLSRRAGAMLDDIGAPVLAASTSLTLARVELFAGCPEAAETLLREAYAALEAMGEVWFRPSVGAMLARALYARGLPVEAEQVALESEALAAEGDIDVESVCGAVRGKILARRGEYVEATALAEQAVALLPGAEAPIVQFEALLDLAEVYAASGDVRRARETLEEAADLAELKAATVPLQNVRLLLDGLSRQTAQPVN